MNNTQGQGSSLPRKQQRHLNLGRQLSQLVGGRRHGAQSYLWGEGEEVRGVMFQTDY